MQINKPKIVAISGFSSNVGKTTLVCDLLRQFPGWEAIKVTRGHYRSCGRDPVACCVSDLISDKPVVRSGREANYQAGKDTGLFWDAGAANVHWVIVTDDQVEEGISEALRRVRSGAVIIEGNSFLEYVTADLGVMCARSDGGIVKPSAREALQRCDALFLSSIDDEQNARALFESWRLSTAVKFEFERLAVFTTSDLAAMTTFINERLHLA